MKNGEKRLRIPLSAREMSWKKMLILKFTQVACRWIIAFIVLLVSVFVLLNDLQRVTQSLLNH